MRRMRALVNPFSTAATRWWCHSRLRRAVMRHSDRASVNAPAPWPAREELPPETNGMGYIEGHTT